MKTMRMAVIALLALCGCTEGQRKGFQLTKYEPVTYYKAPLKTVYDAAKKAMAVEKYKLEVEQINLEGGTATLVTGYILGPSDVHTYAEDKGPRKPCQVKYMIHADLRATEDDRTLLDLRIPEYTHVYTNIGHVWQKTDTMHWRGEKLQKDIAAILAGKPIAPSSAPAPAPAPKPQTAPAPAPAPKPEAATPPAPATAPAPKPEAAPSPAPAPPQPAKQEKEPNK